MLILFAAGHRGRCRRYSKETSLSGHFYYIPSVMSGHHDIRTLDCNFLSKYFFYEIYKMSPSRWIIDIIMNYTRVYSKHIMKNKWINKSQSGYYPDGGREEQRGNQSSTKFVQIKPRIRLTQHLHPWKCFLWNAGKGVLVDVLHWIWKKK